MAALTPDFVPALLSTGVSCRMDAEVAASFEPGDRVTARNVNPVSHTRLPRYIRGKTGTVVRDHGVFAFPDSSAETGVHSDPQHVYSVRFEAGDLWGASANANSSLYIDLFDDYLDPA